MKFFFINQHDNYYEELVLSQPITLLTLLTYYKKLYYYEQISCV